MLQGFKIQQNYWWSNTLRLYSKQAGATVIPVIMINNDSNEHSFPSKLCDCAHVDVRDQPSEIPADVFSLMVWLFILTCAGSGWTKAGRCSLNTIVLSASPPSKTYPSQTIIHENRWCCCWSSWSNKNNRWEMKSVRFDGGSCCFRGRRVREGRYWSVTF